MVTDRLDYLADLVEHPAGLARDQALRNVLALHPVVEIILGGRNQCLKHTCRLLWAHRLTVQARLLACSRRALGALHDALDIAQTQILHRGCHQIGLEVLLAITQVWIGSRLLVLSLQGKLSHLETLTHQILVQPLVLLDNVAVRVRHHLS